MKQKIKSLVVLLSLIVCGVAHAIPALVNYQGTYVNNAGVPVTQTSAPAVISIWNHATSTNTVNRKYQENHTINIDDGNFSLKIGSGTSPIGSFGANLFDTTSALYLQLNINGENMLPRVRFLSAPYTLQSENSKLLDNQPAGFYEERICRATPGSKWITSIPACIGGSADISGFNLNATDLSDVQLNGAKVNETKLEGTVLRKTYLRNLIYTSGYQPVFGTTDLSGATWSQMPDMSGIELVDATMAGLYTNELGSCPYNLPSGWSCISSNNNTNQPPFRLIGPGARFSDDPYLPPATWYKTAFPPNLSSINFRGNYFVDCSFIGTTNLTNTNLFGAHFENCAPVEVIWNNTVCPDGSNSDNNQGSCSNHGM